MDDSYFPEYSLIRSYVEWAVLNMLCEYFRARLGDRYLQIRYEDFCGDPLSVVKIIYDFIGVQGRIRSEDGKVFITGHHNVSGNPVRHQKGWVPVILDEDWKEEQENTVLETIALLFLSPLLKRYGYATDPSLEALEAID